MKGCHDFYGIVTIIICVVVIINLHKHLGLQFFLFALSPNSYGPLFQYVSYQWKNEDDRIHVIKESVNIWLDAQLAAQLAALENDEIEIKYDVVLVDPSQAQTKKYISWTFSFSQVLCFIALWTPHFTSFIFHPGEHCRGKQWNGRHAKWRVALGPLILMATYNLYNSN